jgi:hypothetical protein
MRAGADQAALEKFDEFANKFSDTGEQLNGLLSDATDQAQALRETMLRLGSHASAAVIESESQDEPSRGRARWQRSGADWLRFVLQRTSSRKLPIR